MTGPLRRVWVGVAAAVVGLGVVLALVLVPTSGVVTLGLIGAGTGWMWSRAVTAWPAWLGPGWFVVPVVGIALVGWVSAGGPAVVLPAAGLVWAAVALERRFQRERDEDPGYPVSAPPVPSMPGRSAAHHAADPTGVEVRVEVRITPEDLSLATDAQLCRLWRSSYARTAARPDHPVLSTLADSRRSYLDELERRHPAGFAAWISSGARAAGDPGPYLLPRYQHPA